MKCSHVLHECVLATNILEPGETDLGDDGSQLAARSRDTMGRRTITSGEGFTGDNESRSVGTEVLEEVGEAVKENESALCGV